MTHGYDEAAKWNTRAAYVAAGLVLLIAAALLLAQPASAQNNLGRIIDRWQHQSLDNVPGVYHDRRGGHHLRTLPFYRYGRPHYRKRFKQRMIRKQQIIRCHTKVVRDSYGRVVYRGQRECWRAR